MQRGFSLIELSIVLVILGLLTGGILSGQSLIRAAELRKLTVEFSKINTSMYTFRDKYFQLPGDFSNATKFWGIQAGTTGNDDTCYQSESTTVATCNGNGDGIIHGGYTSTGHHERGRAWQHLANAGLIEGQYTGYHGLSGAEFRISGRNVKASSIPNVHYNIANIGEVTASNINYYPTSALNVIEITVDFTTTELPRGILKPEEAWNVDTKLDDGKINTGVVRGPKSTHPLAPGCASSAEVYDLSNSGKLCYLIYFIR